jgi:hypothetical protein
MTSLVLAFVLTYVLTCIAGYALACHVIRSWRSAASNRTPVSSVAAWHPVVVAQHYHREPPRHCDTAQDRAALHLWAFMPGLNLAALGLMLTGAVAERAAQAWSARARKLAT